MTRAHRDQALDGCLILVSRCPIELARFEGITRRWSVASVLLGPVTSGDVVAMFANNTHTIIAGLDKDASEFILALRHDVMRSVTGLCLVADDIRMLHRAALHDYQGDLVLLTSAEVAPVVLAAARRRFSGLRHVVKDDPDRVRQALRDLLGRSVATPRPGTRNPFVGWR